MAAPTGSIPFKVDSKSAIVTGAGSGINFCFAKLLLSRNCNVLIADLALRPEAEKLVEEYSAKDGSKARAVFVKTDVTIWNDLANMFDQADKEFGGADIVCPGAGIFEPHWTNFWLPPGHPKSKDSPHGESGAGGLGHYSIFDINVTHPIRTSQLAISRWLNPPSDSKVGKASPTNPKRIVHISSIAGQTPGFPFPLYIASKHAISGFIQSLEPLDQTLGIRVNGVAPGVIKTPLWTDHPEKMTLFDEQQDVWVQPEEVAEQMLRCCEDDSIGGGVVWEVLKDKYRAVDWRMDPGPEGTGATVSNRAQMTEEVFGWLAEPGWGQVAK
ncbi:hypothetical protein LTR37_020711 [Vermiconidia calcicola]|uniref:Uncharacterized protein n=1 Tax=Vermiconidia calcicola TaxID=1690605 RepID=A0ACC3MDL8_9PEZI|nr:hypothetical protein LTR37_020711 [Vermiconidia calcicola]